MKKNIPLIISFIALAFPTHTFSQTSRIIGLWEVETVSVGDDAMTPVAKWFRINPDSSYQAGNGWLQNEQGKWSFDVKNRLFSAVDPLGVEDDFGAFLVSFEGDKMHWEREEEGSRVKVTLKPTVDLPMSPADYLKGVWDLIDITEEGESFLADFDPKDKHRLHIRWDRIYVNHSEVGARMTGYWHIHGHRPEITLLPHQEKGKVESWRIEVDDQRLRMTGISDSNRSIQRMYERRNSF